MAEEAGEKSEKPTAKRTSQARSEGQVGKSVDLGQSLGLMAAFLGLQYLSPYLWQDLVTIFKGGLSGKHFGRNMSVGQMHEQFYGLLELLLPKILLLFVIAAFFGAGSLALQTKFLWSNKLLKPKFSNLNPIKGIKKLFTVQNAVSLLKSIAKLSLIMPIAYFAFFDIFPELLTLMQVPVGELLTFTGYAASIIFWRIAPLLLVLAIMDTAWQKYSTFKQLKMTKNEVKDERKAVEGDEKTKMQMRSKGLQRARDRMMAEVPNADVVVTNPTHLAIALKYEMAPGAAPQVVAKGRGYVAERIKEAAKENKVPVVERKALARALYKAVEVGQTIPFELYQAVADLLAYVYRVKGVKPRKKK